MINKKIFFDNYTRNILPKLKRLEPIRKRLLVPVIVPFVVIIMLCTILVVLNFICKYRELNTLLFFFLFAFATVSTIFIVRYLDKTILQFKKLIEEQCSKSDLINCFGFIECKSTQGLNIYEKELLNASGLFLKENNPSVEDVFVGEYNNVPFQIIEMKNGYVRGKGEKLTSYSAWAGVIINIKFNKKIKSPSLILPKKDYNNIIVYILLLSWIAITWILCKPLCYPAIFALVIFTIAPFTNPKTHQEINLEDPNFLKRYEVLSKDQIEARYIISPAFIERYYNLKTAFKSDNIHCAIYDDYIMFAIGTIKDLFEIANLFSPIDNLKNIEQFFNEITAITDIIDHFKLNEKTGL